MIRNTWSSSFSLSGHGSDELTDKLKLELQHWAANTMNMYRWRKLNDEQRAELLASRREHSRPWHSPPHWKGEQSRWLMTGACYEHQPIVGASAVRMQSFSDQFLKLLEAYSEHVTAWCVLPNHYHALIHTHSLGELLNALGKLHGRTSRYWNLEDQQPGRKVWFNCAETAIKSDRHYWATLNYVHHNPVHHGYVKHWQQWPFSSAAAYLEKVGRQAALRTWNAYPILNYGKDWDAPDL